LVSIVVKEHLNAVSDESLTAMIAGAATEEVCSELFRRYNQKIYLWCFNYTHDTEDAVDLTQDIFVKIFRNIGQFAGRSRFSTWVYQITRNHCLGELSKKRNQWRRRLVSLDGDETLQPADERTIAKLDAEGDLDRIMDAAGEVMNNDELDAFVLHYREGLTVKEITKTLGCENTTGARTLIQNARRKFRRIIEEKGFQDE
jgi:RNA polymerase sigma factor (sigma-70 family)